MTVDPQSVAGPLHVRLPIPMMFMVLAGIMIPVELRPLGSETFSFSIGFFDILSNIAGFVPVGMILGRLKWGWVSVAAALISMTAETSQLVMMNRSPDLTDVVTNILGALMGAAIHRRWPITRTALEITRTRTRLAASLALLILMGMWAAKGPPLNPRGKTVPGTLEGHWKFDEPDGTKALDSSGQGLHGAFRRHPARVAVVLGGAIKLDGRKDCVDFGQPQGLRLAGSMTLSAWMNASSFPWDDASIVSSLTGEGYQLDTTVDRGPRTIGFKLTDAFGKLMARYGATPLNLDTWYHVAGVYNAEAKTLNVYLNGHPDDGFCSGQCPVFSAVPARTPMSADGVV